MDHPLKKRFLDNHQHYQIYTGGMSVPLTGINGRTLSKKTSKRWNALKAINTAEGFEVLIGSRGRKQQRFRVLDVDLDGKVSQQSPWMKGAKALFAGWNRQFQNLLLGRGPKGEVKAASTGGDNPVGQLIYTATADDSSKVTYGLKDEGQGFDGIRLQIQAPFKKNWARSRTKHLLGRPRARKN